MEIGKPEKQWEVTPKELPIPSKMPPLPTPAPQPTPEKVPA